MYLISAYFDENTTKALQRYITSIAKNSGNKFMLENHVPPHLTIAAIQARNELCLINEFQKNVLSIKAGNVEIVSVGILLPYVLYVTPVLDEYLQNLIQKMYSVFGSLPNVQISKFYQPNHWLPHVTLGKKLSYDEMTIAIEIMRKQFVPIKGRIVKIGLSKTNPHTEICSIELY